MDETLRRVEQITMFLDGKVDDDARRVVDMLEATIADAFGDNPQLRTCEAAATLMNAAGVLINAASRLSDSELLEVGERWMTLVVDSGLLVGTRWESPALYNLANSRLGITDLNVSRAWRAATETERAADCARTRYADRERLRLARHELDTAARLTDDSFERGMRLCNLANTLDHSGRWIEAYDAYARALLSDPTNGNAAGNAAVLIERVIGAGWDFEGHLCSLYDHYLRLAKDNRAGTVKVAGEGAAQRFDAMELLGSEQPFAPAFDEEDPYRSWVAQHRLALVASLEGLGASDHPGRWDSISLHSVTDSLASTEPPSIFGILNILKADFLVARRLAFDAHQVIETTGGWAQHEDDPGVYTETLNYAAYGEVASRLVLAHRAALDVLDKTAVAVNEHIGVGDNPRQIAFRRFWFEPKDPGMLRSELMRQDGLATAVLSMAELAIDMAPGGLYGHAQDVRNAGTHRFVLLHHGMHEVPTTPTMQAMTLNAMQETCIQSLTVARAAFIYLIAMLEVFEARKASSMEGLSLPLFLPDTV